MMTTTMTKLVLNAT